MNAGRPDTNSARRRTFQRAQRRFGRLADRIERVISFIAGVRLVSFLTLLVCGVASLYDRAWLPYGPGAVVAGIVCAIAVYLHRRPVRVAPRIRMRPRLAAEGQARLDGQWASIADSGDDLADPAHPEWTELQLCGMGSIYQLLSRVGLEGSRRRLAQLMTQGTDYASIDRRQAAAAELSTLPLLRRRVETEARLSQVSSDDLDRLLKWAEGSVRNAWLKPFGWISLALVLATWVQIILTLALDWITAWQVTFLAQFILYGWSTGRLSAQYVDLIGDATQRPVVALQHVFAAVEGRRFNDPYLKSLQDKLTKEGGGPAPSERIRAFERIVDALAVRHGALLYAILAIGFLWELFHCRRLENWRIEHGARLRNDLDVLFDFECLSSMGASASDSAHLVWPDVHAPSSEGSPWNARALGHPLLPSDVRVSNDFRLDRTGQLVLVTGSNMSGKSTFLRTLGINARMALAGAPVCAQSLSLSYCDVVTSIQVVDAPGEGMSRFYAEVKRLAGL